MLNTLDIMCAKDPMVSVSGTLSKPSRLLVMMRAMVLTQVSHASSPGVGKYVCVRERETERERERVCVYYIDGYIDTTTHTTHAHAHMYAYLHTDMYISSYICIHIYIHTYIYTYMHACMHIACSRVLLLTRRAIMA